MVKSMQCRTSTKAGDGEGEPPPRRPFLQALSPQRAHTRRTPRVWLAGFVATLAVGIGLSMPALAAAPEPVLVTEGTYAFGTRVQVTLAGLPETQARARANEVLALFTRMHQSLHAWEPSELTELNAAIAAGRPFKASAELAAMLRAARQLTLASDRLFDPGIGQLVRVWGFQKSQFGGPLPAPDVVAAITRRHPSLADLSIADDGTVTCANRYVAVDLGGYAKGWALDEAAALLRRHGVSNALIDVGGNLMALGTKGGAPWRVGIQHPRRPGPLLALDLHDGEAIGTSGDYYRAYEAGGVRIAHIIDPRSGEPARASQSVTILAGPGRGAGALSDGASKPLYILGPQAAVRAAHAMGVDRFVVIDAQGEVWISPAMASRIRWTDPQASPHLLISRNE